MPEPTNINPVQPAATLDIQSIKVQADSQPKRRAFWRRRGVWLIAALLLIGIAVLSYHWAFGNAKIRCTTAAVTRGDVESTVVAAGIVQPIKYVNVGAQTSDKLKSLNVERGDLVEADLLIAEFDPALADTALTAANASLESMTAKHALKQAQLVLAHVQELPNANKVAGVRAGFIHEYFSAHQGVEDDDLNMICFGGLLIGQDRAWKLVQTYLAARFKGAERFRRRLAIVAAWENQR